MRWHDRVYGEVAVEEPGILELIACPSFQRLKGVRQAGPSALAFPFKNVTRFEHSLGVYYLMLRALRALRARQDPRAISPEATDLRTVLAAGCGLPKRGVRGGGFSRAGMRGLRGGLGGAAGRA